MNWLYSKWWKWLSVVLLLYVVVGSYMIPLSPGISEIEPLSFSPDSIYTFSISAYHTHFKDAGVGKIQFWFKSGNDYFQAKDVHIISPDKAEVKFGVGSNKQDSLKSTSFDVVGNDDIDGTFALREGITLMKSAKVDSAATVIAATGVVEVVHNKHQFLAFPYREILYESIRNVFFHVPMWFVMTALVTFSLVFSIMYLAKGNMRYDLYSHQAIVAAIVFGICGLVTGMIWAKNTWGHYWVNDPKLNGAAVGVMIYFAYLVLRGSISDEIKRARIAAAYNIFSLVIFALFIYIIPRLTDSLHPGNGGNPAFSNYDLDSRLRMFFYPACIGWILLGFWILSILIRLELVKQKQEL
jgi:heme exporter protein C